VEPTVLLELLILEAVAEAAGVKERMLLVLVVQA
tara:strand:- start:33 stop:134 length:102 start_codon:yes stop_codon:yes gene_type:complete